MFELLFKDTYIRQITDIFIKIDAVTGSIHIIAFRLTAVQCWGFRETMKSLLTSHCLSQGQALRKREWH